MEELLRAFTKTLEKFELTSSEIKIYSLLLKEQLTPRQIAKKLDLSERIVREKLKHLLELGLVEREMVNRGWLGYIYKAKAPKEALNSILSKMEEFMENFQKEAKKYSKVQALPSRSSLTYFGIWNRVSCLSGS